MKNSFKKVACSIFVLFLCSVSGMGTEIAQQGDNDFTVIFNWQGNNEEKLWGKNKDYRTPDTYTLLPTVICTGESLELKGTISIEDMPYSIEDGDGATVAAGTIDIRKNAITTISLSGLPAGEYTIILTIGEDDYAGDFSAM